MAATREDRTRQFQWNSIVSQLRGAFSGCLSHTVHYGKFGIAEFGGLSTNADKVGQKSRRNINIWNLFRSGHLGKESSVVNDDAAQERTSPERVIPVHATQMQVLSLIAKAEAAKMAHEAVQFAQAASLAANALAALRDAGR